MNFENFVKMLNYGLSENLINSDTAITLFCSAMPLSFHKGDWAIKRKGGVMVLSHRLVCWYDFYTDGKIDLCDVETILIGN